VDLQVLWFIIIAIFWIGFFVLEGFDLGVDPAPLREPQRH
jgi:cytochrome bd-type quinol oxidase subunit 2